jgi:hypothetical protein
VRRSERSASHALEQRRRANTASMSDTLVMPSMAKSKMKAG